jgi:hypothetical protein
MELAFVPNVVVLHLGLTLGVWFVSMLYSIYVCICHSMLLTILFISTEALSRLYNVIKHPNALDLDNAMAYDNAVSALGKICRFHRDIIDVSQVCYALKISELNHT